MLFVKTPCGACGRGELGFFRAADGAIVLLCERCHAVHPDPREVGMPEATEAGPALDGGAWAERREVEAAGLAHLILGETWAPAAGAR